MPQASNKLCSLMQHWFPNTENEVRWLEAGPINLLTLRGYKLTTDWRWKPPAIYHTIRAEEYACMLFMMDEWDYGGIIEWKGDFHPDCNEIET